MADEQDGSSDLAKLAGDIQKALNAYGECQTQLADIVKPWQDQWAALSVALKPFQEPLVTFTTEWTTFLKQWTQQGEAFQAAWAGVEGRIAELVGVWVKAEAVLATQLAEAGPRLQRAVVCVEHVGQLGWTVTMRMTLPDMLQLSEIQQPDEADAYMLEWYEEMDSDLSRLEKRILKVKELGGFQTVISQCLMAYRRGEYAITIPCLVPVLEGGVRNLGPAGDFFKTNVENMVKGLYYKAKEEDPKAIMVYVWMSLYAFVRWFYQQYRQANSGQDRIFRHGILHGTQPPPNEKIEALRLFHALDTVAALYSV